MTTDDHARVPLLKLKERRSYYRVIRETRSSFGDVVIGLLQQCISAGLL